MEHSEIITAGTVVFGLYDITREDSTTLVTADAVFVEIVVPAALGPRYRPALCEPLLAVLNELDGTK